MEAQSGARTRVWVVDEVLMRVAEELLLVSREEEGGAVAPGTVYMPLSWPHRVKNRLWQAVVIVVGLLRSSPETGADPQLQLRRYSDRLGVLVADVFQALQVDERKSVRAYMEAAAYRLIRDDVALIRRHLFAMLADFDLPTPVAASSLLLANFLFRTNFAPAGHPAPDAAREAEKSRQTAGGTQGKAADEGDTRSAMRDLAEALLPWFSHHTHHVRALASLALKYYSAHAPRQAVGTGSAPPTPGLLTAAALAFMTRNEEVSKMHAHLEHLFFHGDALDLPTMCDLVRVMAPVASAPGEAHGERIPEGLVQRIEQEMNIYHRALNAAGPGDVSPTEAEDAGGGEGAPGQHREGVVQRKYLPEHLAAKAAGAGLSEASAGSRHEGGSHEDAAVVSEGEGAIKGQMIVVASLIDKMPNLAGIARTCEIFQTTMMVVSDKKKMLNDTTFKKVAVSSDRWAPFEQARTQTHARAHTQARTQQRTYSLSLCFASVYEQACILSHANANTEMLFLLLPVSLSLPPSLIAPGSGRHFYSHLKERKKMMTCQAANPPPC